MRSTIRLIAIALTMISLSACQSAPRKQLSDAELEQIYNRALGNQSNDGVQTFSLDGAPAPMVSAEPLAASVPSSDPSVSVFPFDDVPNNYQADMSSYTPPQMPERAPQNMGDGDVMARLYYGHGQTGLKPADEKIVSTIAEQCKTEGCGVVRIDGHASVRAEAKDEVQRRLINLKVSMERASTVSREMIKNGVSAEAIQVTAHGDRMAPVVAPDTDVDAAARRVEITTGSFSPQMY